MCENPRLKDESRSWLLYVLEAKAVSLLHDDYDWRPEDIEYIRTHGAVAIPSGEPRGGRDYSIPWGESGFWLIRPKDPTEEQCLDFLVKVKQIRDVISVGDIWAATALCWQFGHDTAAFTIERLYGENIPMNREHRDEMLSAQIRDWLAENPRMKNTVMARRLQADPQYAPLVSNIKDLRIFVSRLRKKMSL